MVTNQPKDGHPPEGSIYWSDPNQTLNIHHQWGFVMDGLLQYIGWSPINLKMVTHQKEFGTYITKLWPGDNCQEWSPTILRTVTHQSKDGHPPEGSIVQTQSIIATLGSILDSQLSWESGKFQLARWSHRVVLLSDRIIWHLVLDLWGKIKCQIPSL